MSSNLYENEYKNLYQENIVYPKESFFADGYSHLVDEKWVGLRSGLGGNAMISAKDVSTEITLNEIEKKHFLGSWQSWVLDIAIAIIITIIISQFIRPNIVKQESMLDTLYPDDYLLLATREFTYGGVQRGDIVVFKTDLIDITTNQSKNLIKRVIGLPGDIIEIHDGYVYINGEALNEPYVKGGKTNGEISKTKIDKGKMWVMGDNRMNSRDSRDPAVGQVELDHVVGKAIFRVYPFDRFGLLD